VISQDGYYEDREYFHFSIPILKLIQNEIYTPISWKKTI
jgi:hypothetical protein